MPITTERPVLVLLRLEGLAAFAAGVAGYLQLGGSWWLLAALALVPDLAMIGYAFGPRIGAWAYNLAHTYAAPAVLAGLGALLAPEALAPACVWLAHIGIDRALGYGLKSELGFGVTHLGRIGRAPGRDRPARG